MRIILTAVLSLIIISGFCQITDSLLNKQLLAESTNSHYDMTGKILTSKRGALGIAQFMPDTWEWMKYAGLIPHSYDIKNKEHQLKAHKIYMTYLYNYNYGIEYDRATLAVASYHAGVNRILRIVQLYNESWRDHIPDSTKEYLIKLNL